MSRKRAASPQLILPLGKRQAIQAWINDETHLEAHSTTGAAYMPPEIMTTAAASEIPTTDSVFTVGPDSDMFEDALLARGVRDADRWDPRSLFPNDWEEWINILSQARQSPEPTDNEHERYIKTVLESTNEVSVLQELFPRFCKDEWKHSPSSWRYDQAWNQCVHLSTSDKSTKMEAPKPDAAIGWQKPFFPELLVGEVSSALRVMYGPEKFGSYASPCKNICFPVITIEGKGSGGVMRVAHHQNSHNAAIMLNNLHELCLNAGRAEFPYGQVMALTINITAELLRLNCHWISKDARTGSLLFYTKTLDNYAMGGRKREAYVQTLAAVRNCVERIRATTLRYIQLNLDALCLKLQNSAQLDVRRSSTSSGQPTPASGVSNNEISQDVAQEITHVTTASDSSSSRRRKQTPSMRLGPDSGRIRRQQTEW